MVTIDDKKFKSALNELRELLNWIVVLEEEYYGCSKRHYYYQYEYGYTTISVFEKEFNYSWKTKPDDVIKIGIEIEKYIKEHEND